MPQKSSKRILQDYSNLKYTVKEFDKNGQFVLFQKADKHFFSGRLNHFMDRICGYIYPDACKPFERNASYTIRFYDTFAQKNPSEQYSENCVNGYPVIHRIERNVRFWVVRNETDIQKIQEFLRSKNLSDTEFLAVTVRLNKLYSVFPNRVDAFPLELWNFFNKKHRGM